MERRPLTRPPFFVFKKQRLSIAVSLLIYHGRGRSGLILLPSQGGACWGASTPNTGAAFDWFVRQAALPSDLVLCAGSQRAAWVQGLHRDVIDIPRVLPSHLKMRAGLSQECSWSFPEKHHSLAPTAWTCVFSRVPAQYSQTFGSALIWPQSLVLVDRTWPKAFVGSLVLGGGVWGGGEGWTFLGISQSSMVQLFPKQRRQSR